MSIRTFLINLDRSIDRLEFMTSQFELLGMTVERISAVNGFDIPKWMEPEFNSHKMSAGEVGCYASHLLVAQRIVADGLPYAVVLEDDAILADDFLEVCRLAIHSAPPGWDYIHMSSVFKRPIISIAPIGNDRRLVRYMKPPVNTAAYILSNAGARKWLKPRQRVRPNDVDNRYAWIQNLHVLGVYPAPAQQAPSRTCPSTIQHTDERKWHPGRVNKIYGEYWNARHIGVGLYARGRVIGLWNSLRRRLDGKSRVAVL